MIYFVIREFIFFYRKIIFIAIIIYINNDVSSKAILLLLILIIIQIFQYYDNPFMTSDLNKLEFDSFFSMFAILLLTLYSFSMDNYSLSIFLYLVVLFFYVRFLYLSLKFLLYFQIKKLLQHKKIQNSRRTSKFKFLIENTQTCKDFFIFLNLIFLKIKV